MKAVAYNTDDIILSLQERGWKYQGVGSDYDPWSSEWCKSLLQGIDLKDGLIIIDWGCGYGRLYHFLSKLLNTFSYYGFEIHGESNGDILVQYCQETIPDAQFDFTDSILVQDALKKADAVILGSVVTHLRFEDSIQLLQKFQPVIDNNGAVIFSTILGDTYKCSGPYAYGPEHSYSYVINTRDQINSMATILNYTSKEVGVFQTDHWAKHTIFKFTKRSLES
jgi:phospholipid N-methyltransferase